MFDERVINIVKNDSFIEENESNSSMDNERRKPPGEQLTYCDSALPWQ